MELNEVKNKILNIIKYHTSYDLDHELTTETPLINICNYFTSAEENDLVTLKYDIIGKINKEFNLKISLNTFNGFNTVQDIIGYVDHYVVLNNKEGFERGELPIIVGENDIKKSKIWTEEEKKNMFKDKVKKFIDEHQYWDESKSVEDIIVEAILFGIKIANEAMI